ncbi:PREDICTED: protein yippee-like 2 isoform X1 [Hipposideros armiger]|uniref:Protein yippee-like n=1 Tax=Hipposideros armiger TaxID=186990 RepID=A0A8B7QTW4_HIPAR|nr:PREDICTED: protein yippee-like 2 isoform X1 [Hipposideros armiger]
MSEKSFQGSQGRAYLFNSVCVGWRKRVNRRQQHLLKDLRLEGRPSWGRVFISCKRTIYHSPQLVPGHIPGVNVGCGPAEERVLLTGLHAVADIYCENCKTTLGWKYEHAFESSQKYKEGKYIIELAHMIKDNGWD